VPTIRVVRDPNDDMILAAAIVAKAKYLVTRNNDLLSLGKHKRITILTPEAFLAVLRESRWPPVKYETRRFGRSNGDSSAVPNVVS
jgi:hypothetical protein